MARVEGRPSQPWSLCEPREEDDEELDPSSCRQHMGGAFSLHVLVMMSVWALPLFRETTKPILPEHGRLISIGTGKPTLHAWPQC